VKRGEKKVLGGEGNFCSFGKISSSGRKRKEAGLISRGREDHREEKETITER